MHSDDGFWKRKYRSEWKAGAERVSQVLGILRPLYPSLQIEPKDYALSENFIKPSSSHVKHDPDITVTKNGSLLCEIEVSGSFIDLEKDDPIYVLLSKYRKAVERKTKENIDTWFWLVFDNGHYSFDLDFLSLFKDKLETVNFKGFPETYISIPEGLSYSARYFVYWLNDQVRKNTGLGDFM